MSKADVTGMMNFWFDTNDPFVPTVEAVNEGYGPWMALKMFAGEDAFLGAAFWIPKGDADRAAALAAVLEEAAADLRRHADSITAEGGDDG